MVFGQKWKFFDFSKKGYHRKGHLKRSRMVQISAPQHLPVGSYECGPTTTVTKLNTSTDPHVSQSSVEGLWCDARVKQVSRVRQLLKHLLCPHQNLTQLQLRGGGGERDGPQEVE